MHPRLSAGIAAVVIAHASGRQVASIYDHTSEEERELQANAIGPRIACYDGTGEFRLSGELPNLLQSPEGAFIHLLQFDGGEYRGFDHGSQTHFTVRPDGLSAAVYDHGRQRWSSYAARPATS